MSADLGASESLDNEQGDYLAAASKEELESGNPPKPEDDDPEYPMEKGQVKSEDKAVSRTLKRSFCVYLLVRILGLIALTGCAPLFMMLADGRSLYSNYFRPQR